MKECSGYNENKIRNTVRVNDTIQTAHLSILNAKTLFSLCDIKMRDDPSDMLVVDQMTVC